MSKSRLRLLGVKATLKSDAEMLVLLWHGLSERDSILRVSAAWVKGNAAASSSSALGSEGSMVVMRGRRMRAYGA